MSTAALNSSDTFILCIGSSWMVPNMTKRPQKRVKSRTGIVRQTPLLVNGRRVAYPRPGTVGRGATFTVEGVNLGVCDTK
jgi:hypothetical protein